MKRSSVWSFRREFCKSPVDSIVEQKFNLNERFDKNLSSFFSLCANRPSVCWKVSSDLFRWARTFRSPIHFSNRDERHLSKSFVQTRTKEKRDNVTDFFTRNKAKTSRFPSNNFNWKFPLIEMDNINDDQSTNVSPIALAAALTGILALVFSIVYLFLRSPSTQKTSENEEKSEEKTENSQKKSTSRNKPTGSKFVKSENKNKFSHPWLCTSLKAHSASVTALDFSHHDKYLASVSDGWSFLSEFQKRTWMPIVFSFQQTKQFYFGRRNNSTRKINGKNRTKWNNKLERPPSNCFLSRHTRVNIEYGQASRVAFSPDEKFYSSNENHFRFVSFFSRFYLELFSLMCSKKILFAFINSNDVLMGYRPMLKRL